jgi:hypothetical protein
MFDILPGELDGPLELDWTQGSASSGTDVGLLQTWESGGTEISVARTDGNKMFGKTGKKKPSKTCKIGERGLLGGNPVLKDILNDIM